MARARMRRKHKPGNLRGYDLKQNRITEPDAQHPLLVAFTGKLACGKGTCCDFVTNEYPEHSFKMSWADGVKLECFDVIQSGKWPAEIPSYAIPVIDKCKTVLPTDREKIKFINDNKQALRPLLQQWGTEYRRHQDPDYWVKQGVAKVKAALADGKYVIVNDDTRFPNEAQALQELGFTLVRVLASDDQQADRAIARDGKFDPAVREHASETSLDSYYHPVTIKNTGSLIELWPRLRAVVSRILNPKPTVKDYSCLQKEPQATNNSAPTSSAVAS